MSIVGLVVISGANRSIPLPLMFLMMLSFLPFTYQTFFGGQASWFGMAVLSAACVFVIRDRDLLAGLALSLSYYKPPLFVFLLTVLILSKRRSFVLGFAIGAALLLALTWLLVGYDGILHYLGTASRYVYGQEVVPGFRLPPEQGMGLWALGVTIFDSMLITATILAAPIIAAGKTSVKLLRSDRQSDRTFGLILATSATLAFSPQLINYDLAILLVPMVMAVAWRGEYGETGFPWCLLPFVVFYFEALFRRIEIAGLLFNASAVFFALLLACLIWQGRRMISRNGSTLPV
jgi:hypothetical protein